VSGGVLSGQGFFVLLLIDSVTHLLHVSEALTHHLVEFKAVGHDGGVPVGITDCVRVILYVFDELLIGGTFTQACAARVHSTFAKHR
jgi:hypothetical protein